MVPRNINASLLILFLFAQISIIVWQPELADYMRIHAHPCAACDNRTLHLSAVGSFCAALVSHLSCPALRRDIRQRVNGLGMHVAVGGAVNRHSVVNIK